MINTTTAATDTAATPVLLSAGQRKRSEWDASPESPPPPPIAQPQAQAQTQTQAQAGQQREEDDEKEDQQEAKENEDEKDEDEDEEAEVVLVLDMDYPTDEHAQEALKVDLIDDIAYALSSEGWSSEGSGRVKSMLEVVSMKAGSVIVQLRVKGKGAQRLKGRLEAQVADATHAA